MEYVNKSERSMISWMRVWYWGPPLAYAGLIFALSSLSHPDEQLPSFIMQISDKALHAAEYGLLGVLCYRAFRHAAGPWWAARATALAILVASLYGVTDEVHQAFVPLRESSGWDVLADTVGACVAVLMWRAIVELIEKSREGAEGYQA